MSKDNGAAVKKRWLLLFFFPSIQQNYYNFVK